MRGERKKEEHEKDQEEGRGGREGIYQANRRQDEPKRNANCNPNGGGGLWERLTL